MSTLVLAMLFTQVPVLDPDAPPPELVPVRALALGKTLTCPMPSQWAFCDDPTTVEAGVSGLPPEAVFTARKVGATTCSCGPAMGFRTVYRLEVWDPQAAPPLVKKVVGKALWRLYRLGL
jgi:hypothetical protein